MTAPPDPRRLLMRSAVAAGGASAALMSFSMTCDGEAECRAAASEALEPLLRAALFAIDAAGVLSGEDERRRLRAAIGDYVGMPDEGAQPSLAVGAGQ